jgi:hypothetical protein
MQPDDFDGFFADRQRALLDQIGVAMGKPINLDAAEPPGTTDVYEPDDDTDDL